MKPKIRKIIGRREWVSFPELGLVNIEAKIDTGAYTSALHCKDVKQFVKDDKAYVSFMILDNGQSLFDNHIIKSPIHKIKKVKNSFGQVEERIIVKTRLDFFDKVYVVEISLADRSAMDYPVLLGRKVLKKRFLVDASKVHYAAKRKTIEYN
jgi:hypothetical protein